MGTKIFKTEIQNAVDNLVAECERAYDNVAAECKTTTALEKEIESLSAQNLRASETIEALRKTLKKLTLNQLPLLDDSRIIWVREWATDPQSIPWVAVLPISELSPKK